MCIHLTRKRRYTYGNVNSLDLLSTDSSKLVFVISGECTGCFMGMFSDFSKNCV